MSTSAGFLDVIWHLLRPVQLQPQRPHNTFVVVVALQRFITRGYCCVHGNRPIGLAAAL